MRLFLLCIGFVLAVYGGVSLLAYLNLLTVGFSLKDYGLFIIQRIETYLFITGIIMIWSIMFISIRQNRPEKIKKK